MTDSSAVEIPKEEVASMPTMTSESITPPRHQRCSRELRKTVVMKRKSIALTPSEVQFVDHLLEHGDDRELQALAINLSNTAVFMEKDVVEASLAAADATVTDNTMEASEEPTEEESVMSGGGNNNGAGLLVGSTKRQEYLKSRMSCTKSKELWKGAATKVMSAQRLSGAAAIAASFAKEEGIDDDTIEEERNMPCVSPRMRASTRSNGRLSALTIPESLTEHLDDDDDDDDSENDSLEEEKKEEDEDENEDDYFHDDDDSTAGFAGRQSGGESEFFLLKNKADAAIFSKRGSRPELVKSASINMYHGEGFEVGKLDAFEMYASESGYIEHYDPWMFTELDEDGHKRIDNFRILGTSYHDLSAQPHVLSPILMQSLQEHLPQSNRGQSFWLKYSLVRDGASTISFLQQLRGSRHTLLACETVDGDVFGFFGCQPWVVQPSYFGTGECFVWRMKHSRVLENGEQYHNGTMSEQIQREAEIEVFPAVNHTGNRFYQLCQHDKIAIGGGVCSTPQDFGKGETPEIYQPEDIGFALIFDDTSLLYGSSSACMTFQSPPLAKNNAKGLRMEFVNVEVWSLTPCLTVHEAQQMENKHLFLKRHATF